jgi:hypothetical protein
MPRESNATQITPSRITMNEMIRPYYRISRSALASCSSPRGAGPGDCLRPVHRAQPVEHAGELCLDGPDADGQEGRDLLVGQPSGGQREDLDLSIREERATTTLAIGTRQLLREARMEDHLTLRDRPDGSDHVVGGARRLSR